MFCKAPESWVSPCWGERIDRKHSTWTPVCLTLCFLLTPPSTSSCLALDELFQHVKSSLPSGTIGSACPMLLSWDKAHCTSSFAETSQTASKWLPQCHRHPHAGTCATMPQASGMAGCVSSTQTHVSHKLCIKPCEVQGHVWCPPAAQRTLLWWRKICLSGEMSELIHHALWPSKVCTWDLTESLPKHMHLSTG